METFDHGVEGPLENIIFDLLQLVNASRLVIPAKAGIHQDLRALDPSIRGDDTNEEHTIFAQPTFFSF
jgi:hypothetical protein